MDKINSVIDNLIEDSGCLFEIIYDNNLQMPGMSIIIQDKRGVDRYKVIINYNLIKNEPISVIAHIFSHEWGHHILKHTLSNPTLLSSEKMSNIEIEADIYAYKFIVKYGYNSEDIKNYIKKNFEYETMNYKNKLDLFKRRIDVLNM